MKDYRYMTWYVRTYHFICTEINKARKNYEVTKTTKKFYTRWNLSLEPTKCHSLTHSATSLKWQHRGKSCGLRYRVTGNLVTCNQGTSMETKCLKNLPCHLFKGCNHLVLIKYSCMYIYTLVIGAEKVQLNLCHFSFIFG